MNHVRNSMLCCLPYCPRFAHEPVHEIYDSEDLSFRKSCNFEHHSIDVASEGHIKQKLTEVFPRILEPLVGPLSDR